jgi:peptidoglycan/xylan/chitin deacetylase (PgdA/CDA1 family)
MQNTSIFTYILSLCFFAVPIFSCHSVSLTPQNSAQGNPSFSTETPNISQTETITGTEIPPAPSTENEEFWNMDDVDISHISPARKLISFTFDDAPSRTLENILAVYASFNEENPDCRASATFFCNSGRFDTQTSHLLHACLAMGMELGNHTHSHYDLTTLAEPILLDEIDRTDNALFEIDGKTRHLLRAPYGKTNDFVKSVSPVPLIDWTIDTLDWSGVSADAIYRAVYENRFSGAIVLMHDGYKNTVDALKRLLPDLMADGYQVVSVSQLAKAHGCTFRRGSSYIRARKQN